MGGAGHIASKIQEARTPKEEDEIISKLKAGAITSEFIDTGLKTGQLEDKPFTSKDALDMIGRAQEVGVFDQDDLDRFKERYPQLRDGLNGVVAENLKEKINQELSASVTTPPDVATEPRPDSISALKKDMEKMKAQREEDVPAFEPEGNIVDLTNQDLSGLNILEDKGVNDNGQVQTETAIENVSPENIESPKNTGKENIQGTEIKVAPTAPAAGTATQTDEIKFAWQANKEGGQKIGNKEIIRTPTLEDFEKEILPRTREGYYGSGTVQEQYNEMFNKNPNLQC